MKKYELIQVQNLYIDIEELVNEVIRYFDDVFAVEDYHLIDSVDMVCAVENAIECQDINILYSDYDNWSDIVSDVYNDMVEYIDTHHIEHDLIPVIKNNPA